MREELSIRKNFIAEISKNWQSGDLIVVSSRPGMGKTNFILSIFQNKTFQQIPSEFISMNNINGCSYNGVEDCNSVRKQNINQPITSWNTECVMNYLQDSFPKKGTKYVFIDNVKLMNDDIPYILFRLKHIAKTLSIIIITTIPLDKANKHEHTKPSLRALKRKVPAIEGLTDFIYLIHRPIYYTLHPTEASLVQIIIAKSKVGKTGYFPVCLNKTSHFFEDFDLARVSN